MATIALHQAHRLQRATRKGQSDISKQKAKMLPVRNPAPLASTARGATSTTAPPEPHLSSHTFSRVVCFTTVPLFAGTDHYPLSCLASRSRTTYPWHLARALVACVGACDCLCELRARHWHPRLRVLRKQHHAHHLAHQLVQLLWAVHRKVACCLLVCAGRGGGLPSMSCTVWAYRRPDHLPDRTAPESIVSEGQSCIPP
jgi:hypothetical protein